MSRSEPKSLPVDPARLRARFPDLSEDDLEAYVAVTRRVLKDPAAKARAMREVMDAARAARAKDARSGLTPEESLALRYLRAVEKMQGSTTAVD